MATFKTLQDRVLANTFDDVTYRPLVMDWINDAYRLIHRRARLPLDDSTQSFNTVAGTSSYTLTGSPLRILGVSLPIVGDPTILEQGDLSSLDTFDPNYRGQPVFYVLSGGKVLLGPTPDAAYPVAVDYSVPVVKLVNDTDLPTLPEEYHDMLIVYGRAEAFKKEEDWEQAQQWSQDFETRLLRFGVDQQHPGDMEGDQLEGCW